MRDYAVELEKRVAFIQDVLSKSGAKGIVFGNSGGKDSALVGILCKKACDNTVGIMMPCESKRNFGIDMDDGGEVAKQFGIENRTVDITETKQTLVKALSQVTELNQQALTNINPRLRMATVYAVAAADLRGEHLLYSPSVLGSAIELQCLTFVELLGEPRLVIPHGDYRTGCIAYFGAHYAHFTEEHALDFAAYSAFNYVMSVETGFAYGSYIIQVAICAREEAR